MKATENEDMKKHFGENQIIEQIQRTLIYSLLTKLEQTSNRRVLEKSEQVLEAFAEEPGTEMDASHDLAGFRRAIRAILQRLTVER